MSIIKDRVDKFNLLLQDLGVNDRVIYDPSILVKRVHIPEATYKTGLIRTKDDYFMNGTFAPLCISGFSDEEWNVLLQTIYACYLCERGMDEHEANDKVTHAFAMHLLDEYDISDTETK